MLFFSLCCEIISLISLIKTHIQAFHLLLGFAENQTVFWDFNIQNNVWTTKDSDNGIRIIEVLLYLLYSFINKLANELYYHVVM